MKKGRNFTCSRTLLFLCFVAAIYLITLTDSFSQSEKIEKERANFKRETVYPDGQQTNYTAFKNAFRDKNAGRQESYVFRDYTYEQIWSAMKYAGEEFARIGKRPLKFDDQKYQTFNTNIGDIENNKTSIIKKTWFDEVRMEATQIDSTYIKVTVTRKIMTWGLNHENKYDWVPAPSDGKIERWLITQVEDALKNGKAPKTSTRMPENKTTSEVLDNTKVAALAKANFSDNLIIKQIENANGSCKFDVSTDGLIYLRNNKVSERIIEFIMGHKCMK